MPFQYKYLINISKYVELKVNTYEESLLFCTQKNNHKESRR